MVFGLLRLTILVEFWAAGFRVGGRLQTQPWLEQMNVGATEQDKKSANSQPTLKTNTNITDRLVIVWGNLELNARTSISSRSRRDPALDYLQQPNPTKQTKIDPGPTQQPSTPFPKKAKCLVAESHEHQCNDDLRRQLHAAMTTLLCFTTKGFRVFGFRALGVSAFFVSEFCAQLFFWGFWA